MTQVTDWFEKNKGFRGDTMWPHAVRLLHEAVELCIAAGASSLTIQEAVLNELAKAERSSDLTQNGVPELMAVEAADVAINLEVLCHLYKINLDDVKKSKMAVNNSRNWKVDRFGVLWRVLPAPGDG